MGRPLTNTLHYLCTTRSTYMQQPLVYILQTLFQHKVFVITSTLNAGSCCSRHFSHGNQSRTQIDACARATMALALGKLNFSCAVIGLTFINRTCRQRTGIPKFRGSGCQFPQSQCLPSPRTGIALGTRLHGNTIIVF